MLKIFVTGGLGAIGSFLIPELRHRRHDVYFCDLSHHHHPNYIRCDIKHYRQLERVFEEHKFDYVYNLAAEFGRWNGEDYYENLWLTNAVGMKHILRLQEKHGFRLIHTSSSEVYGDFEGVMAEDVMDKFEIRQMNDYAITKWVNELQIMNSATMQGGESVRVRIFNTYGPGEKYSSYRSVICLFCYRALNNLPYTVYLNHHRTSTFITDMAATLANIVDNFKPGEVYNIGGIDYHDIKTCSDIILEYLGKDDSLVTYKESEMYTTKNKKVNISKAINDLKHASKVTLKEGIPLTIEWMKKEYGLV
jgi:dTDP-glucose 4,6-dehydratase